MSGYVQATSWLGTYVQVEDNPYVLGYVLSVFDGSSTCNVPPIYSEWCVPNHFKLTIGETIKVLTHINIPSNVQLPSAVSFYMKVENTGQVVPLGTVTPETGYYSTAIGYFYEQGYQVNPDTTVSQNPLTTVVTAFTTFKLEAVMNDVNGNPVHVFGPVSFYITISTPGGTYIGEQIVGYEVYFPTRIVNFKVSPNPAMPGQSVTISGQLQRLTSDNQWVGAPDQVVSIFGDGKTVTDSNGNFSVTVQAPWGAGTYVYYAIFDENDSEWLMKSWAGLNLTVVQPTTPKPAPQPSTTITTPTTKPKLSAGDLAIVGGGLAVLVGTVAYGVSKRKK